MTLTPVDMPALDGRDPLGFLASLGVLRLLHDSGHHARLSFSTKTGTAQLHSPFTDTDQIANALQQILEQTGPDSVLPGAPADFPLPKQGSGADPMRLPRPQFRQYAEASTASDLIGQWLPCLVTDLAVDNNARVAISPYMAPSGQQSIRSFFTNPIEAVRAEPDTIHQALVAWQRRDNFTGEYLDHRVLNNAADHPSGKSTEAGVPGATWLAIMALSLFRVTGAESGNHIQATSWHRIPGRRIPVMVWPLWKEPLTVHSVRVILEHPALQPYLDQERLTVNAGPLAELGVFYIAAAERQTVEGRKFAGALAPCPIQMKKPSHGHPTPPKPE